MTTSKEQYVRTFRTVLSCEGSEATARAIVDTIDAMITERMGEKVQTIYRDDYADLLQENARLREKRDAANQRAANADETWRSVLATENERHRAALARAEKAEKERDDANKRADAKSDYAMRMDALAEERAIAYNAALTRAEAAEAKLAAIYAEQTPVSWANRYPSGINDAAEYCGFRSEARARESAQPDAIEIAVPLYRHPAPPVGKVCGYAVVKNGEVIDSATTSPANNLANARLQAQFRKATVHEPHLGREVPKESK